MAVEQPVQQRQLDFSRKEIGDYDETYLYTQTLFLFKTGIRLYAIE